jgi:hypothetical protein
VQGATPVATIRVRQIYLAIVVEVSSDYPRRISFGGDDDRILELNSVGRNEGHEGHNEQ